MKSSTLVCLLALVAVSNTAPQFPILSPIGSPFLPVQPGWQDESVRLIPGGFVYSAQGNRQNGSWPWGLMNLMPFYPTDPRSIIYLGSIFSVSLGDSNPIKEIEPVAPIIPPAKVADTPTVAAISRCIEDDFYYRLKSDTSSVPYKYMVESDITSKNQYPFMVALVVFDNRIWQYKLACGGSLISSTKILTAAHCVTEYKSTNVIDANLYEVKFGVHFLSITENDAQLSRKVQQIKIHENYDPVKIYNDIAILTLSSPVEYTATISPVCLVPKCFDDDGNRQAIAMGWGHTQSGGLNSDYLRHAFLSTVPFSQCQKKYRDKIDEVQMLCAFKKGQDTCQNDSGGPLVMEFPHDSSCRFMQIGIVSFGKGCAFKNYPGVYVRVKNYLPWIEENTN